MEFLSEVVMGKIMKGGKVVLLLSGRLDTFLSFFVNFSTCDFLATEHLFLFRYAGRKAVIVKPSDEGTSDKPFR